MEPESLLKVPPADSGGVEPKGNCDKAWRTRVESKGLVREGSPSIKLGLGIDSGSGGLTHVMKQDSSALTPTQLHELHQQSLIFKYIVAGLAVPSHLVLPIWKSVASSFGSANGGVYNQYPSFVGFSPQGFKYRSMMDPEPMRCKRTDGKKWRCRRNVVPDLKYCERHMHRGRQRSRKHVEGFENILEVDTTTTISSSNTTTIKSNSPSDTNTNFSIPVPENLQLTTPSSNTSTNVAATVTTITTSSDNWNSRSNNYVYVNNGSSVTPTTIYTTATATTATFYSDATDKSTSRNNNYPDGKDAFFNCVNGRNKINRSNNNGNNPNFVSFVAPGFGFSPKTDLRGGTIVGCSTSGFDHGTRVETNSLRCKRTDGKKWRCSWDVVPDQKYCGRHLHRGAKKVTVASESVTVAVAAPLSIPKKVDNCIKLNTNLSISIMESPKEMSEDENNSISGSSSSSSSSDATTITD